MKKKELKSLRTKKMEELSKMVSDKKMEATVTYAKMKAGQEKNLKKVSILKREIAQVLTIMREKELAEKEEAKEEPKEAKKEKKTAKKEAK